MSIYQNTYFIVPRRSEYILFEGLNLKSFLQDNLFEDDLFWSKSRVELEYLQLYLKENFGEDTSWSKTLKIYGNHETNSIELVIEGKFVFSISFRVNFITDYSTFLLNLIKFCELNDFLIIDNDLNVLPLDYNVIKDNILNSKAYKNYKKNQNK